MGSSEKVSTQALADMISGKLLTEDEVAIKSTKQSRLERVDFEKTGSKIIIPEGMTYETAMKALTRKREEEETDVSVNQEIECYPMDGAFALMQVLKEKFGWATAVPEMTFFGPIPPQMISLEIGPGKYTQIIWGNFSVPGIEGKLTTGATRKDKRFIFVIRGTVKRKYEDEITEIATAVRAYVRNNSIYRGKAIRLHTDESGDLESGTAPTFLDLSRVNPEELVLPDVIAEEVQTSLYTPIEYTDACRSHKIPLKRGILLEGPFGTGKTLTAFVTATKCEKNGWTFIYLDRVGGLDDALQFARQYMPAVVFAEDIDRVVAGQDRSVELDDVLNNIDGIESKGAEIMTVLTTNNVETINRAMLRPGRLDAVISIMPPDAKAAQKLMRIYAGNLILPSEELLEAGEELAGQIPAVIREVVERSKLHAIWRTKGDGHFTIAGVDMVAAAQSMKKHLSLMVPPSQPEPTPEEKLGASYGMIVAKYATGDLQGLDGVAKTGKSTHQTVAAIDLRTKKIARSVNAE